MFNNNYIDNRSYEELVETSTPTGAYDNIVYMIRADKKRNGEYKLYKGAFEYYELDSAILKNNLERNERYLIDLKKKIDESRNSLDVANEKITKLKNKGSLTESEKKEIKILTIKISNLEENISEGIDEIPILESTIVSDKDEIEKFKWKEYVARYEYYGLRRAHDEYFKSNNLDYLRKAVHMICSYSDKLRYGNSYVAPYKGHILKQSDSPFSPEQTHRMNYSAEYSDWLNDNW